MLEDLQHYYQRGRDALEACRSDWVRWSDDRYGTTWAPIVGGIIGEDPATESNVAAAERLLSYHVELGAAEPYTVGRSGRTWVRGLAVRVFDDEGHVTDAWVDAIDLVVDPLQDYPLLDEDGYLDYRYAWAVDLLDSEYGQPTRELIEAVAQHYGEDLHDLAEGGTASVLQLLEDDASSQAPVGDYTRATLAGTSWWVDRQSDTYPVLSRLLHGGA